MSDSSRWLHLWQQFYKNIKDDSWPECLSIDDFSNLPKNIQQEILLVHKGYIYLNRDIKKQVAIIPIDKKYSFLKPKNCSNFYRVGSSNDGGYVIPKKMIDLAEAVLSGGLSFNWDFEIMWSKLNPEVVIHAYDASIEEKILGTLDDRYANTWNNKKVYFPKNLGSNFFPLSKAVDLLPVQNIFLKLDIEGSEYSCIDDIIENKHKVIGMVIEFHEIENYDRFETSIKKLQKSYDIVHLHANNTLPYPPDGEIPYVMEITLIRKDYVTDNSLRHTVFLFDFDQPCDPAYCDWFLNFE